MAIVILILSVIISNKICKVINRNTIGTITAYLTRAIVVWAMVLGILSAIANGLGLI